MKKKITGTGVALITPFNQDDTIDFISYKKLLDFTMEGGVDYYVVQGTTGEAPTTKQDEKEQIIHFIAKNNTANLPIVYGLGGNDTAAIIHQIQSINILHHIDALLSVVPYYNKPSQEGIYQHYKAIAAASPVPIILYNVPSRTGINLEASTTLRLAKLDNILGIKEASGNLMQCMEIMQNKPVNFLLISGDDMLTLPIMAIGGDGAISVLANGFPSHFSNMVHKAKKGQYSEAQKNLYALLPFHKLMYQEGNPVGIKQLLALCNICQPYVRRPHTTASIALQRAIATALDYFKKKYGKVGLCS